MRTSLALIVALVIATSASIAQKHQAREAYTVVQEARILPNGTSTLQRTFHIVRPEEGTYIPGRLLIKTRARHGQVRNSRLIDGSSVNAVLTDLSVTNINSAFPVKGKAANAEAAQATEAVGLDRIYVVRYSADIAPFDVCRELMRSPDVEYAEPILIHKAYFTPNDPLYSQQSWMQTMQMAGAWDVTKGSADVLIAIVDSGTDWQHEDLKDKIWTNPGEVANNGVDDDNNGYIDDTRGWDFVGNVSTQQAASGQFLPDNDPRINWPTVNATNGHGTIVAGCAGAHTNNSKGVASTGFNSMIIPIKCGIDNSNGQGIFEGYSGIMYAADLGADIINCSWGGTGTSPGVQDVIDYATARGSLVVAASGNNGVNNDDLPHNPASLDGVLSVGSVGTNGRPSNFSNYGWGTHTYAPGQGILSTFHGDKYQTATGTSFSSPLTAGICALIKARHPDWTPEMIKEQLRSTSDPMGGVGSGDRGNYFGMVNATRALSENQTFSSGTQTPGIVLRSVSIAGGSAITSYEPTQVTLKLQNILGNASGVSMVFSYSTPGVSITPSQAIQIGAMAHNATKDVVLTVDLGDNFPWYEDNLALELIINTSNYENFIRARIPIKLPSSNLHTTVFPVSGLEYTQAQVSSDRAVFAASNYLGTPILIRGSVGGSGGLLPSPMDPTAMYALSGSRIILGGVRQGSATISASSTGGAQFVNTVVSSIMTSVVGIHMFSDSDGMAVGTGSGAKFGVARTTDGGASWVALTNAPPQNAGEKVIEGTAFFLGDALWFATTENRVIYSTNRGQTWGQGKLNVSGTIIESIAFRDAQNGVMIYRTSASANAPILGATSVNGGAAWQVNSFDPATLGIRPVAVASPGGHHLLIGEGGEVYGSDNNGAAWQPVLSRPNGAVVAANAKQFEKSYLIECGEGVGVLAYRYSGPNGTKILVAADSKLQFDTIESGKSRQRYLQVSSTGESDVIISAIQLDMGTGTPDSAFRVTVPLSEVIEAGTSDNLGIRCYGTTPGSYTGTVTITSNATPPVIQTPMEAVVTEPTSVYEDLLAEGIVIAPNPASDVVTVTLPKSGRVFLYNMNGQMVGSMEVQPTSSMEMNVGALPVGAYIMVIHSGRMIRTLPVAIVR